MEELQKEKSKKMANKNVDEKKHEVSTPKTIIVNNNIQGDLKGGSITDYLCNLE